MNRKNPDTMTDVDCMSIPAALRPLVKRLEACDDVSTEEMIAILFIARLVDSMHSIAYATFLTLSFMDELRKKLSVPDLELELEISATRWSYKQGLVVFSRNIACDFDGDAMHVLGGIALGVLKDKVTPLEGLRMIEECERGSERISSFSRFYRTFPGRILVIPLMGSSCGALFFGGTYYDFFFSLISGTIAGLIHYLCTIKPQLHGIQDMLASISTAFVATASWYFWADKVCFRAQILGVLYWFLYGVAFMISIYEMTSKLLTTGIARFTLAIISSFVLGFGVVIGVWLAAFAGPNRFDELLAEDCSALSGQISDYFLILLYPAFSIACIMQLRISPKHWIICLIVQFVGVGSQYLLVNIWDQPVFVSNFLPAYLATLTAHIVIVTANSFNLTQLNVGSMAYLLKKFDKKKPLEPRKARAASIIGDSSVVFASPAPQSRAEALVESKMHMTQRMLYVDKGWAEEGQAVNGYVRNVSFQYQRSDLWYCLLPALYILVPGSRVLEIAFFSLMKGVSNSDDGSGIGGSIGDLVFGAFVIGIGQVLGVRLAVATLWIAQEIRQSCFARCCERRTPPPKPSCDP
jgi:uncharacterized membrane protein YjjP (DUF1212 family)